MHYNKKKYEGLLFLYKKIPAVPNKVERNFHSDGPYKLLLSDINSYLIGALVLSLLSQL